MSLTPDATRDLSAKLDGLEWDGTDYILPLPLRDEIKALLRSFRSEKATTELERELAEVKQDRDGWIETLRKAEDELESLRSSAAVNVQHAPRVERNTFQAMHNGKMVEVVYATFAACLERESNSLRSAIRGKTAEEYSDTLNQLSGPGIRKT
jgi:hypothetical protein